MLNEKKDYFVGLDVGTNSVGYAVIYDDYKLVKYKGEPMWGSTMFDTAELSAERRGFRTARRRLNRRQQRVHLIQELFAKEIAKKDPNFFIRIRESNLFREDKTDFKEYNVFFKDKDYNDSHYYKKYPTIHHLIFDLMENTEEHDVRLVYIACAWLVAHRGHFLSEVSKENIANILDFEPIYKQFIDYFDENEIPLKWKCSSEEFSEILKQKLSITAKEKKFYELLFNGKKPKDAEEDVLNISLVIKLICGGKVKLSDLFKNEEYKEISSVSLGMKDEEFSAVLAEINEDADFLLNAKGLYDWAVLTDVLKEKSCISEAKVITYEQHKKDLKDLKKFIKKYKPEKYNEVFRGDSDSLKNYPSYIGQSDSKHSDKEEFSEYLKKLLKGIACEKCDEEFYADMMERIALNSFLPKQVNNDNRVIPYQLYWYELKKILDNASVYLDFLSDTDEDEISVKEKILSVFEYRIPYFVGPLSKTSWMKRKAEGGIYPWNFDKMVDLDASEQEFIKRMTNTCTYISGEYVLPKNSLLYTKYEVLNQINNLKINGTGITVQQKKKIYNEFYCNNKNVTVNKLKKFMIVNGMIDEKTNLEGIDMLASSISMLKPYVDFRNMITCGMLSESDAETIIERITYSEDKTRLKKWLKDKYNHLSDKDIKYILSLKYKDFGRLSEKLLNRITGVCKESGEVGTIIHFLWETNDNFMHLMSERYTFADEIKKLKSEYYGGENISAGEIMEEMYISNSVKRPIYRTLDIMKEITSAMGYAPKKIFVEMARGAEENKKNKRTSSRKQQIIEWYKKIKSDDVKRLSEELENLGETADNQLQSEVLFLYFMQLGKCMYTGKSIDINQLKSSLYNVDHIYPRSYVKDDSILNNKVLVMSKENGEKSDVYPLPVEWQNRMAGFWYMLKEQNLIEEEKYKRLTRTTPFSDDEKMGFINRQLVETRQSTKAIAAILNNKYENTDIVYVKAGLVSDFRHEYNLLKCRSINDLHHAKDAYLNAVVGNVYNEKFTKNFNLSEKYSLNNHVLFGREIKSHGRVIWNGSSDIENVKRIMKKNNIHMTRFAFCRKGGFFDQMPVKAAPGLVPLKKGLDTEKYGGYNRTTATFFVPVKFFNGKKYDIMIMPVELLHSKKFIEDDAFADEYIEKTVSCITGKNVSDISLPLGKRILKINTVFSLDGFRVTLSGKSDGGKRISISPFLSFIVSPEFERYIKRLERYAEKLKENVNIVLDEKYDKITKEKNIELYEIFKEKFSKNPYSKMPNNQYSILDDGYDKFVSLELNEQLTVLLNILFLFKTGRAGTTDLTWINGSKNSGVLFLSSLVSNWLKNYSDIRIIDTSASGIYEKCSANLAELI